MIIVPITAEQSGEFRELIAVVSVQRAETLKVMLSATKCMQDENMQPGETLKRIGSPSVYDCFQASYNGGTAFFSLMAVSGMRFSEVQELSP